MHNSKLYGDRLSQSKFWIEFGNFDNVRDNEQWYVCNITLDISAWITSLHYVKNLIPDAKSTQSFELKSSRIVARNRWNKARALHSLRVCMQKHWNYITSWFMLRKLFELLEPLANLINAPLIGGIWPTLASEEWDTHVAFSTSVLRPFAATDSEFYPLLFYYL